MQNRLMTQTAETGMAVNDLNLLAYDDVSKERKKREDRWKGGLPINDEERNVVDFETVCQVTDAGTVFVGMGDDDDFVAAINELAGELVDVALDSSRLGEEEVADHCNIVRHLARVATVMAVHRLNCFPNQRLCP